MTRSVVAVPWANLPCWIEGEGSTEILVVHGGPDLGSTYLHRPLSHALGDLARLHFYDQRGTGQSEPVEPGSRNAVPRFNDLVRDLDNVRRYLKLATPVLMAHSFGALVALRYVESGSSGVRGVVLIDPDPPQRSAWAQGLRTLASRRTPEEVSWLSQVGQLIKDQDPNHFYRTVLRPCFVDPDRANSLEIGLTACRQRHRISVGDAVRNDLGDWDFRSELRGLPVPTLLVTGAESFFPADAMSLYASLMPQCTLVTIGRAAHFPHSERPDCFRQVVTSFLNDLDAHE